MRLPNGISALSFIASFHMIASCSFCVAFSQLSRPSSLERCYDMSLVVSNIYLIKKAADSAPNLTKSDNFYLFSLWDGWSNSFLIYFPRSFLPVLQTVGVFLIADVLDIIVKWFEFQRFKNIELELFIQYIPTMFLQFQHGVVQISNGPDHILDRPVMSRKCVCFSRNPSHWNIDGEVNVQN